MAAPAIPTGQEADYTDGVVARTLLPGFADLPVFDIRNGPPEAAVSLLIKATIPQAYHWVPIKDMPPTEAVKHTDAYIATYLARFEQHPPANMDAAARRKVAICLGVSRAVTTSYYQLNDSEIVPGEKAQPLLGYTKPPDADPSLRILVTATEPQRQILQNAVNLTEDERAVLPQLLLSSLGIMPLQGFSLMMNQHHYLSDTHTQSYKAFAAVERQFWKGMAVSRWFEDNTATIQDALWHKSCHPINMALKYRASTSLTVKEQLIAAGAGSAAARLPAMETDVRAANSYQMLFSVVRPMFAMYDGGVDTSILDLAISTVNMYPPAVDNPAQIGERDQRLPTTVTNRRSALQWLKQIVDRNMATAAQCFGFYCAMADQGTMVVGGGGSDTLRSAFSLAKLRSSHLPSYTMGQQQYGDYAAARARARSKGVFEAPIFKVE